MKTSAVVIQDSMSPSFARLTTLQVAGYGKGSNFDGLVQYRHVLESGHGQA